MSAVLPRNSDRVFFGAMTGITFAVIFVGFARTFFLKPLFDTPALSPLIHLHGVVAAMWPALMVTQVVLIRARNYQLHRALGMFGIVLAVLFVITAAMASLGKPRPTEEMRAILILPMHQLVFFSLAVAAGIRFRHEAASHKRLMYLATFITVMTAMRRLQTLLDIPTSPYQTLMVACVLLLLPLFIYDAFTLRRIHPVTWGGTLLILVAVPLHSVVGYTAGWQNFADWLTNQ
jgi:uncharacterized membrane protein YozB (DUF420 family)